jgi:hypothetical protein
MAHCVTPGRTRALSPSIICLFGISRSGVIIVKYQKGSQVKTKGSCHRLPELAVCG